MREQWRAIPDWEGIYEASTYGRVRSLDRTVTVRYRSGREDQPRVAGKILTPTTKSNGYQLVQLYEGGAKTWAHVQHLVLRAFVGDAPPGCEADTATASPTPTVSATCAIAHIPKSNAPRFADTGSSRRQPRLNNSPFELRRIVEN
jgi:hypothetical protein